jgi:hypothetical protein
MHYLRIWYCIFKIVFPFLTPPLFYFLCYGKITYLLVCIHCDWFNKIAMSISKDEIYPIVIENYNVLFPIVTDNSDLITHGLIFKA